MPRFEKRIFGEQIGNDARRQQIPRSRSDNYPYGYDPYARSGISHTLNRLHIELLQGPGCESYPYLEMDETCE